MAVPCVARHSALALPPSRAITPDRREEIVEKLSALI